MTERAGGPPGTAPHSTPGNAGRGTSGNDAGGAQDPRAEEVLAQALRVMAGGGRSPSGSAGGGDERRPRLSTGQLVLLAAIVGLLVGIGAGFLSLM